MRVNRTLRPTIIPSKSTNPCAEFNPLLRTHRQQLNIEKFLCALRLGSCQDASTATVGFATLLSSSAEGKEGDRI